VTIPDYVTVTYSSGDYYIAYHPELPTARSQGSTPEEARENLAEATRMTIEHLVENNLPIPPVMSMEEVSIDLRGQ
jgi:predicted RNase H-like HicB family nuclease